MKSTLALPCAVLLAAGLAYAQEPSTTTPSSQGRDRTTSQTTTSKTTRLTAEVVSTDSTAKTITVRNAMPAEHAMSGSTSTSTTGSTGSSAGMGTDTVTLPVDTKAAASLKSVNAGDKVTLTCGRETSTSSSSSSSMGSSSTSSTSSTGSTGTTGTTGTTGSTGSTLGSSSDSFKIQASCPTVTAIAKVKASSSPDRE